MENLSGSGLGSRALVRRQALARRSGARARWTRSVVFLSFVRVCTFSATHPIAPWSSEKLIRTALHAYVTHLLNLVAERWVPGFGNS